MSILCVVWNFSVLNRAMISTSIKEHFTANRCCLLVFLCSRIMYHEYNFFILKQTSQMFLKLMGYRGSLGLQKCIRKHLQFNGIVQILVPNSFCFFKVNHCFAILGKRFAAQLDVLLFLPFFFFCSPSLLPKLYKILV